MLKDAQASKEEKDKAERRLGELKRAEGENEKVQSQLAATVRDDKFVAGFGSNGGEEFLSFLNISEAMLVKGGKDWKDWDAKMTTGLEKAQDKDGSWQVPQEAINTRRRGLNVYTFWGTAWATIGMLQTLPAADPSP